MEEDEKNDPVEEPVEEDEDGEGNRADLILSRDNSGSFFEILEKVSLDNFVPSKITSLLPS